MDKLKSYRPEVPDRLPNDPQPEIIYPHAVALSAVDTGGGASLGEGAKLPLLVVPLAPRPCNNLITHIVPP